MSAAAAALSTDEALDLVAPSRLERLEELDRSLNLQMIEPRWRVGACGVESRDRSGRSATWWPASGAPPRATPSTALLQSTINPN